MRGVAGMLSADQLAKSRYNCMAMQGCGDGSLINKCTGTR